MYFHYRYNLQVPKFDLMKQGYLLLQKAGHSVFVQLIYYCLSSIERQHPDEGLRWDLIAIHGINGRSDRDSMSMRK